MILDGRLSSPACPDGPADDAAKAILSAYERLGSRLLSEVAGEFSLLICDAERRRVLCVRDPVGLHPLLYAESGDTLIVSPYLEPLLQNTRSAPSADPVAVVLSILGYRLGTDETLFPAVKRVPPGHVLERTPTRTDLSRYWDPGEPGCETGLSAADAADQFEALLFGAAARCVGSAPVAVFLSGGVDSAIVAAAAAAAADSSALPPPLGLSLMVDHPDLDEESNQRAVAADLGLDLVHASVEEATGHGGLLTATLRVSAAGSAGPADIIQPIYDFLADAALQRGISIICNGQGGDEWLLPTPEYAADRLLALDARSLRALKQAHSRYYPIGSQAASGRHLVEVGARTLARAAVLRGGLSRRRAQSMMGRRLIKRLPPWLAPSATLRSEVAERAVASAVADTRVLGLCRFSRLARLDRPGRPGNLEHAFATHRRLGVKIAMPLLDADVVRFLHRLPVDRLVDGGQAKALARPLVTKRLPRFAAAWSRTVSGARYYGNLIERETPLAWRKAGGTPYLGGLGVVDETAVQQLMDAGSQTTGIWPVTNLDVWLRASLGTSSGLAAESR